VDEAHVLVDSWTRAIELPSVAAAIREQHAIVAAEVARRKPLCLASGRCCHFESHGHRLYVTGLEAAWCVGSLRQRGGPPTTVEAVEAAKARGDCPFLIDGRLCGAHIERPLGCRIYFCDRAGEGWQEALYEQTHEAMRALHEDNGIAYRYGEWRAMLELVCGGHDVTSVPRSSP